MDISFRIGEAGDAEVIVDLVLEAGDGLFESLLDGVVPGIRAKQFLRLAVKDDDSPLNFANAIVAVSEGTVVGLALSYPVSAFGLPLLLQSLLPDARLEPFKQFFDSRVPASWYLNSLSVRQPFRGQGLARLLVGCCGDLAASAGQSTLSLHVWADNAAAMKLYHSLGFNEIERIPVPLRAKNQQTGEMVLMSAALPLA